MSDAAYELHADIEQRDEQHEAQSHTVPTNPVGKIGYERAKPNNGFTADSCDCVVITMIPFDNSD